ncbi:MAG: transposase, partial [Actinobacteria bacterium]|nr:transposase [Actinomycetota bacterium]
MPRQPRIEYEGAIYHVVSRGDRREDIVVDDRDRLHFVETLAAACAKCDWQVHAWVLMSNHFHLVIETPLGDLATGMKWLLGRKISWPDLLDRLEGRVKKGAAPRARWIEVHVIAPHAQVVRIAVVDEQRFVASGEEMADEPVPAVEAHGVG